MEIAEIEEHMKEKICMSDLGLLSYYLGIEVKQTQTAITVNQSAYAALIMDKCGMAGRL